ncbi:MAG: glycosyltransferase [Ferruginibacter sp.]
MHIVFTVTTDLNFDQRMMRICHSLATAGYEVLLVGRKQRQSIPLEQHIYQQKRLNCWFQKGPFFYAEYNIRLFFFLLFHSADCICAIDLDTILPCLVVSKLKRTKRVYDAHELFCEMKEIVQRPIIYKIWKWIERHSVPHFNKGYTVNEPIALEFKKLYGVNYQVVSNIAVLRSMEPIEKKSKFILYQGAVNEGRSFETLIPAMKKVNAQLIICGEGNYFQQAKNLVQQHQLENKVIFKGWVPPTELRKITQAATIGITLFDATGLSNYYSLANRFFDYIHAGIPQICVDFPVYRSINENFEVAVLVRQLNAADLSTAMNNLLENTVLYEKLQTNCMLASLKYNWQEEEKKLLQFYAAL